MHTLRSRVAQTRQMGARSSAGNLRYQITGNVGVSGVTVALGIYSTTSGADGSYTLTGIAPGTSGNLTPTKAGVTFEPANIAIAAMTASLAAQNFAAYGPELVLNGGFETLGAGAPDLWANWNELAGSGAIADEGALVHGGSHAAKITTGATVNTRLQQTVSVVAGKTYRLIFWTRGDGTNQGQYDVFNVQASNYIRALTNTGVAGTTYQQVTHDFLVPAGCTSIIIELQRSTTVGGVVYFDDVSIRVINP